MLSLRKGHDFFVENTRVVVSSVLSGVEFVLKLPNGELMTINDTDWTEILPGVLVQSAIPKNQSGSVIRIALNAPGKKVLRGELYRKGNNGIKPKCGTCGGSGTLRQKIQSGMGNCFEYDEFPCPDCSN